MLAVTFHFDTVEAAAEFLATQGVQPPQVEAVIPAVAVRTDALPDTQPEKPQPEKKVRKPRADAGKPRGPYKKDEAAEAPAPAEAPATVPAAKPAAPEASAPAPTGEVTVDDLRAAMTVLAKKKNIEANMALLRKFGVGQVSKLPKEQYPAFLAAVKAEAGV